MLRHSCHESMSSPTPPACAVCCACDSWHRAIGAAPPPYPILCFRYGQDMGVFTGSYTAKQVPFHGTAFLRLSAST